MTGYNCGHPQVTYPTLSGHDLNCPEAAKWVRQLLDGPPVTPGPSPEALHAAVRSPQSVLRRAIYDRQRELNEIRAALGLSPHTTHDQVLTTVTELRKENRDRTN